jgi:hypothetical protein
MIAVTLRLVARAIMCPPGTEEYGAARVQAFPSLILDAFTFARIRRLLDDM